MRLFGGCGGERGTAEAPVGLKPGPTFARSIAALVVYLHYAHAIGMERLARPFNEVFALSISEGSISNTLLRARTPLLAAAATTQDTALASNVVCSDETSVRVKGKTWWEWVFAGTRSALHVIGPSRGKAVVRTLFGAIRSAVWVSDMLGSQRGHTTARGRSPWRICCVTRATPSTAATCFQPAIQMAAAAGDRDSTAATGVEGQQAGTTPDRLRPPAEPDHGD